MFFKRKPKPPLMGLIDIVNEVVKIAYKFQHDRTYTPSEKDLGTVRYADENPGSELFKGLAHRPLYASAIARRAGRLAQIYQPVSPVDLIFLFVIVPRLSGLVRPQAVASRSKP